MQYELDLSHRRITSPPKRLRMKTEHSNEVLSGNADAVLAQGTGAQQGSAPDHILQFFKFTHLPPALADVSRPFAELAASIVETIPRNPERTVALRKLLESKDAAVRAALAKPDA